MSDWYQTVEFSPDVELLKGLKPGDRIMRDGLVELVVKTGQISAGPIEYQLSSVWIFDEYFEHKVVKDSPKRIEARGVNKSVKIRTYSLLRDGRVWDKWVTKVHWLNSSHLELKYRDIIANPELLRTKEQTSDAEVLEKAIEDHPPVEDPDRSNIRKRIAEYGALHGVNVTENHKGTMPWLNPTNPFGDPNEAQSTEGYVPHPESEEEAANNRVIDWQEIYQLESEGKIFFDPVWRTTRTGDFIECWTNEFDPDAEPTAEDLAFLLNEDIKLDQVEPSLPSNINLAWDTQEKCWYKK